MRAETDPESVDENSMKRRFTHARRALHTDAAPLYKPKTPAGEFFFPADDSFSCFCVCRRRRFAMFLPLHVRER